MSTVGGFSPRLSFSFLPTFQLGGKSLKSKSRWIQACDDGKIAVVVDKKIQLFEDASVEFFAYDNANDLYT